jgi:hypothetical protein
MTFGTKVFLHYVLVMSKEKLRTFAVSFESTLYAMTSHAVTAIDSPVAELFVCAVKFGFVPKIVSVTVG